MIPQVREFGRGTVKMACEVRGKEVEETNWERKVEDVEVRSHKPGAKGKLLRPFDPATNFGIDLAHVRPYYSDAICHAVHTYSHEFLHINILDFPTRRSCGTGWHSSALLCFGTTGSGKSTYFSE